MNFSPRGRAFYRPFLVLAALALAAAPGCGPAKAKITGTVKYNGEPLPTGTITFLSDAGNKPVKSGNIVDGKYTITDFVAGPAKVTVATTPPSTGAGTPPPNSTPAQPPAGVPAAAPPPSKYVQVPRKYADPERSGLTYEVMGGDQSKDFELTSP